MKPSSLIVVAMLPTGSYKDFEICLALQDPHTWGFQELISNLFKDQFQLTYLCRTLRSWLHEILR